MSEEKTIEAGNSLPQPLGSAAFSVWSEARGVWPRLTHEEIFRAGWDAAIAAATAHVKDQALTTDEIAAAMRRDLLPNTALSGGEAVHSNGGVGTLNQKGGE